MSELREAYERMQECGECDGDEPDRWCPSCRRAIVSGIRALLAGTPAEGSPEPGERALRHLAVALRKLLSPEEIAALSKRIDPESPLREFVDFLRSESGTPASREPGGNCKQCTGGYVQVPTFRHNELCPSLVASEGSEPLTDMDTVTIHRGSEPEFTGDMLEYLKAKMGEPA